MDVPKRFARKPMVTLRKSKRCTKSDISIQPGRDRVTGIFPPYLLQELTWPYLYQLGTWSVGLEVFKNAESKFPV